MNAWMPSPSPVYDFVFAPVWRKLFPSIVPETFKFTASSPLPFADPWHVLYAMLAYYVCVHGGQRLFKVSAVPAFTLRPLFFLHNVFLSLVSALLLALIVENLAPRIFKNGLMWGMCHRDSFEDDRRLELFYYLNYLCKFYEFFDTLFLVVRKKRVEFLHWFHHSMTMLLCYTELMGRVSLMWIPITLNLLVHVLMYYYYARTSVSSKPIWWKKYLTTMQIVQFVIDLVFINLGLYILYQIDADILLHKWTGLHLPLATWSMFGMGYDKQVARQLGSQVATCAGDARAGIVGWALINSYLLLFIQFFRKTYSQKGGNKATGSPKKYGGKRRVKKE